MRSKTKRNIIFIVMVVVILGVLIFLLCSKNADMKKPADAAEEIIGGIEQSESTDIGSGLLLSADEQREEHLALFENIGIDAGKILVIGHKSPDTDTVGTAIAYANLLNKLGYDSEPRIASDKINNETKYVLEKCNLGIPEFLETAAGKTIVMVDHNELIQAADGMDEAEILAIIDHHTLNCSTGAIIKVQCENVGATATLVALDYELYGVEIDPVIAKLLAYTIISDTENFKKSTTTSADRIVYEKLAEIGGLGNPGEIYKEMKSAKESYDGMSDVEIYFSDYKEYITSGYQYAILTLNSDDAHDAIDMGRRMKNIMVRQYETGKNDFIIAKIKDKRADAAYLFVFGEDAERICKQAFPSAQYGGEYLVVKPSISRKSVMVPAINSVLEKTRSTAA